ncbi:MAG: biotin/lipoyl-binding protein, partial [Hyphomonadaceae bacterium]|nr:biotin/lipoyl-binding protein [Hyphomonadaceae bacterium]
MKRTILLMLAIAAAACADPRSDAMQGYGEADYIYLASQESGVLSALNVREGDLVEGGDQIFTLDPGRLSLNEASASAQSAAAAQAVRSAQAEAALAESNFVRGAELFERGFYPRARLDADRAARDAA